MSSSQPAKVVSRTAQQSPVLAKLALFALCLGLAPIGTYYGSQKYIWEGNATYAAITAVLAANVVLVFYIISSIFEDAAEEKIGNAVRRETRKDQ